MYVLGCISLVYVLVCWMVAIIGLLFDVDGINGDLSLLAHPILSRLVFILFSPTYPSILLAEELMKRLDR